MKRLLNLAYLNRHWFLPQIKTCSKSIMLVLNLMIRYKNVVLVQSCFLPVLWGTDSTAAPCRLEWTSQAALCSLQRFLPWGTTRIQDGVFICETPSRVPPEEFEISGQNHFPETYFGLAWTQESKSTFLLSHSINDLKKKKKRKPGLGWIFPLVTLHLIFSFSEKKTP